MDECAEPESLSQYELKFRDWIGRWYDYAVAEGFLLPPVLLDELTVERLEGYFFEKLTPAEGAQAFFGRVH